MIQGSGIDSSLNETGRQQAALFFETFSLIKFDRVYVSALQRTHQSVAAFTACGIPTEIHPELNEISWGEHEGKVANSLDKEYFSYIINSWKGGRTNIAIRGGESPEELTLKQEKVIKLLRSRTDEKRVLICMHGRAMRIFLCNLLSLPLSEMDRFHHENLCLYILRLNDDGTFEIKLENHTDHLLPMAVEEI